ncbi:MAG: thioredoxin TrxC [Bauldia sp.]|nr:thioredoxin TrxC [Bauldia sp.]
MNEAVRHIVCPHCDSVNRLPAARDASAAKCGKCSKPLFSGAPAPATTAGFAKQIERNDIPVVADFWAEWCGPCHAMAPSFARAAAEMEPKMRFLKVDTEAEPQLAARYQIRSIPTLIVFRGGKIVGQRAGAMNAGALRDWLAQYV